MGKRDDHASDQHYDDAYGLTVGGRAARRCPPFLNGGIAQMVHYKKVIQGITQYINDEFISRFTGSWKAWVLGTATALAAARMDNIFQALRENAALKVLGLVDGENIDAEAVLAELKKQAQKGTATVSLPVLGAVTFGPADVDALYRNIMGA